MKISVFLMVGAVLLLSGSTFGTTIASRSTGSYGLVPSIGPVTSSSGSNFQEVVVCQAGFTSDCVSSGPYDLLLAFTDDSEDGNSFTMNLGTFTPAMTQTDNNGSPSVLDSFTFGVLTCGAQTAVTNNGVTFCTDTTNATLNTDATNCENALSGEFDSGGSFTGTTPITIPGACVANGLTLYFDETSADVAAPNFTGATAAPEPSSLALLGMGLFAVLVPARRRLLA